MTTTRKFSSTDVGAPVLTGQNGSLIALLKACLVGTAGVAYGSKAAAGWSEPFTNTGTKAVFRNSLAAGGAGCYSRILDDGSLAAGAKEAGLITYQAMSDLDTGVDPAPAAATLSTGVFIRKSFSADATARAWELVADELTWYLNIRPNTTVNSETSIYGSGDFYSEVTGDAYRYFAIGRSVGNVTTASQPFLAATTSTATPASNGLYVGRNYSSTGTSISLVLSCPPGLSAGNTIGGTTAAIADPAPGTGNRYFTSFALMAETSIRGSLRGLLAPINNLSAQPFGTVITSPTGGGSGSQLLLMHGGHSGVNIGVLAVEQNRTW